MDPRRILIVEDELVTALVLKEHLIKKGYIVCGIAANYDQAIELALSANPDLALVDILLEGSLDGIATALALVRQKEMPVIYLTASSEDTTFERAKITKPAAFLYKPYRESELINQVELAIQNFYSTPTYHHSGIDEPLFIPFERTHVRLDKNDIIYIEADRNYSDVYLKSDVSQRILGESKKHLPMVVSFNLGFLSDSLPANFYRLSQSILINLNHVHRISYETVYVGPYPIRIPEGKYKKLMEKLNTLKNR